MIPQSLVISVFLLSGSCVYAGKAKAHDVNMSKAYDFNESDLYGGYSATSYNAFEDNNFQGMKQYAMIDDPIPTKTTATRNAWLGNLFTTRSQSKGLAQNELSPKTQAPCCTTELRSPCSVTEVKPSCATTFSSSATVIATVPTATATATSVLAVVDHDEVVVDDEVDDDLYTTPSTTKTSSGSAINKNSIVSVAALGFIALAMVI